jgi:hypothetical protein
MMNRTGRFGQASAAAAGAGGSSDAKNSAAARIENARMGFAGLVMDPPGAGQPLVTTAVAALALI